MKKYKCQKCKDSGVIRYKRIDGHSHFSWVPWKTKRCSCSELKEGCYKNE